LPSGLRLGVLAPHPDDFDAIAVTLRELDNAGHALHLAVATGGASGVTDEFAGCADPQVKGALREAEQRASLALFGLPPERCDFLRLAEDAEGHPVLSPVNRDVVQAWLLAVRPDLVFLPHPNDPNAGHQRIYRLLVEIAEQQPRPLIACLNHDPKTTEMRYDLYTPFDAVAAEWKAGLLRCHRSQDARNRATRGHGIDERILRDNAAVAQALRLEQPYAEGFELQALGVSSPGAA
jgi:LmbE family N-acetylglucosaminyl deacetylase